MDATEIRRRNARNLSDEAGGMPGFGRAIDRAQAQVSAIIGSHPTRGIGHRLARHIEEAFNKPPGWLDIPHWETADSLEARLIDLYRQSDDRGKAFIMRVAEQEAAHNIESSQ